MERERHPKHEFDAVLGAYAVLLFVFMLYLTIVNETSIFRVMYAFLPTIMYLAITYVLLYQLRHKRFLLWILPLLLVLLFHLMVEFVGQEIIQGMDPSVTSYLNLLVSYVFAATIMFYIYVRKEIRQERAKIRQVKQELKKLETIEERVEQDLRNMDLRTTIQSIEDKCKALNFAIGRVYSNKHGGSDALRAKIRIDKEWYNKFSELSEDFTPKHKEMIRLSVNLILKQLKLLDLPEKEVFLDMHASLTGIQRSKSGKDRILDVLIANDKDPVETYVKSARQFCNHVLSLFKE